MDNTTNIEIVEYSAKQKKEHNTDYYFKVCDNEGKEICKCDTWSDAVEKRKSL